MRHTCLYFHDLGFFFGADNANLFRAVRNLPRVKAVDVAGLNIYDVLAHKSVVFSRRAFEAVLEKLS